MMNTKLCLLVLVLLFSVVACNNCKQKAGIIEKEWKYDNGFHIGDFLYLNDSMFQLDDQMIIYKQNKRLAKVLKVDCKELIIQSIDNQGKVGRYVFFADAK